MLHTVCPDGCVVDAKCYAKIVSVRGQVQLVKRTLDHPDAGKGKCGVRGFTEVEPSSVVVLDDLGYTQVSMHEFTLPRRRMGCIRQISGGSGDAVTGSQICVTRYW